MTPRSERRPLFNTEATHPVPEDGLRIFSAAATNLRSHIFTTSALR